MRMTNCKNIAVDRAEPIYILGIETSCDETSAAIVADGRHIVSNVIASQIDLHQSYGGVVPELASRQHVKTILPVIEEAVSLSGLTLAAIDGIAVTAGPGLIGALLVGVSAAKALAFAIERPLIAVNHLAGHIAANYLCNNELEPPFLALVVSGAHAHIVYVQGYSDYSLIARTQDDAAGEVFDKLARAVGLGYPGGPIIEQKAQGGNCKAFPLPHPLIKDSLDFSFSGVKTAALNVLNQAEQLAKKNGQSRREILSDQDFAATVQETIVEILTAHLSQAQKITNARTITLAGGVSANLRLREAVTEMADQIGVKLIVPDIKLCTDNAAMIAAAGYFLWRDGIYSDLSLNATALWELSEI